MSDIARTLGSISGFPAALDVHLVETSPVLAARQKQTLERFGIPVTWHERFGAVPQAPSPVISNRLLPMTMPLTNWRSVSAMISIAAGRNWNWPA